MKKDCPYKVGDKVRFSPSDRTKGLYQNINKGQVQEGEVMIIKEIKDQCYLYGEGGKGGWPWNEWERVE